MAAGAPATVHCSHTLWQSLPSYAVCIADLHLSVHQFDDLSRLFVAVMASPLIRQAEQLFILGDWFDMWLGDELCTTPAVAPVLEAVAALAKVHRPVYVCYGNHDFLMREVFFQTCHAISQGDGARCVLYGVDTLLVHGDTFCTQDTLYQKCRHYIRQPQRENQLLAVPLPQRLQAVRDMVAVVKDQDDDVVYPSIMDVCPESLIALYEEKGIKRVIHGHTHQPRGHWYRLPHQVHERWVLPPWRQGATTPNPCGGALLVSDQGCLFIDFCLS